MKKKALILLIFIIICSPFLLHAKTEFNHLILGLRIPLYISSIITSPNIPINGFSGGAGVGFYLEILPIRYLSLESGFYVYAFNLGGVVKYYGLHVPIVGKFRFPFTDRFSISLGAGTIYCYPFSGNTVSVIEDAPSISFPDADLISDWGVIVKIGFSFKTEIVIYNLDIGIEGVDRPTNIKQTDLIFAFGIGFGLF